ncbi:MAG TPA: ribulose-phosphate 3-epimerase [Candidatus Binataceae bacterium]|nr:ribulose-phosphate 3-epimerase [Candidatus Binataceae bacterium]
MASPQSPTSSRAYKIAPSILSADFARLGEEIRKVEMAGADLIHFDVMDGHFVPNLSIGIPVLQSVRAITALPLDAHLMIEEPERYLEAFVKAGANSISVHAEVCDDLPAIARRMHQLGIRAAIAINPETDADRVLAAAADLDMILVMSVHPGFGGQGFIQGSLEKLRTIRRDLARRRLDVAVEVDGGIKIDNIAQVAEAGANVFVSGSGIFGHSDYGEIIARMRREVEGVLAPNEPH